MEVVYDNSVTTSNTINTGQGENISMVIHDAEDDASPSQKRSVVISRSLHKSPKFKSLFDQLDFGVQVRTIATEALMKISAEYGPQCYVKEAAATIAFLESINSITFTDEDMKVPYSDHRWPLYLEAWINGVHIKRALVDTGSSINILPLAVLTAAKIPIKRIIKSEIQVTEFGNKSECVWASSSSIYKWVPSSHRRGFMS